MPFIVLNINEKNVLLNNIKEAEIKAKEMLKESNNESIMILRAEEEIIYSNSKLNKI